MWYLGYFTAASLSGSIYYNGMIYSLIEITSSIFTPRLANRFGPIRVAICMQIPTLTVLVLRLVFFNNYPLQVVCTFVMALNAAVIIALLFPIRAFYIPEELNAIELEIEIVAGNVLGQGASLVARWGSPAIQITQILLVISMATTTFTLSKVISIRKRKALQSEMER